MADTSSWQFPPSIQYIFPSNKSASGSLESVQERYQNAAITIESLFPPRNSEPSTLNAATINNNNVHPYDSIERYFPAAASWPCSSIGTAENALPAPPRASTVPPTTNNSSTQPNTNLSALLLLRLAFHSLGIVYGELGTAPLYVFKYAFPRGIDDPEDVVGALSLIIYSLMLIPLVKYMFIVCKADDNGQGGTLALYSLICRHANVKIIPNQHSTDEELTTYTRTTFHEPSSFAARTKRWLEKHACRKKALLILVLVGTCMLIGDGILAPGILVLGAAGGIKVNHPHMSLDFVVIMAVVILVAMFGVQQYGIDRVGWFFAPIMLVWFLLIGGIGIFNICKYDRSVLKAFSPLYLFLYFKRSGLQGWFFLQSTVLSIAGTEALFANLGYFPVSALQIAFVVVVFPSLLLAYSGQAAYLMSNKLHVADAFYHSIPGSFYWPTFIVATAAAMIASQATISATYSVVKEAHAHGCFPRVKVVHTSKMFFGQIYVPEVNWILLLCCIAAIVVFKNQTQLGNAYGMAVVLVMLITTLLMTLIMILVWRCHWILVLLFAVFSLAIEGAYFSVLIFKVFRGSWLSIVIASAFFMIMYVWHYGRLKKYEFEMHSRVSMPWILSLGPSLGLVRVPGTGLVYTELVSGVPRIFSHLITHLPAIHSVVIFMCVKYLPVYTVPDEERFLVERIGPKSFHMFHCVARYGYKDLHRKDDDFEKKVFDSLFMFVRLETIMEGCSDSEEGNHSGQQTKQSVEDFLGNNTSVVISAEDSIMPADSPAQMHNDKAAFAGRSSQPEMGELEFLIGSRNAGVLHILGNTEVRARGGSSFCKKVAIDHIYAFLRKICREMSVIYNVPRESLLNVGQVFYV